jgi:hypothetical protein
MKRKFSITIFNNEEVKLLTSFFPPVQMKEGTAICYEGHIPQVAIFLSQGEVIIKKRKNVVCTLEKNEAYGLYHLIHRDVLSYSATLNSEAKISIITRTAAMEIVNTQAHPLHLIFSKISDLVEVAM